jgi:hypothetical protein
MILGGLEDLSETGGRSVRPLVGGRGKSAPLDAVRRRWCAVGSWEDVDLMLSDGAPMIPVSRMTRSSLSLLVSLFATLTLTSASNARRPGVIGEGRGER